jgi:hypothetical protein
MPFVPPVFLARTASKHPWLRDRLLSSEEFASYLQDRGLSAWSDHVSELWRLGLLRADVILGPSGTRRAGLQPTGDVDDGLLVYADARSLCTRRQWANVLKSPPDWVARLRLLFHPYRYHTVLYFERLFELHIHPFQMLKQSQYPRMLRMQTAGVREVTRKDDFAKAVSDFPHLTVVCAVDSYGVVGPGTEPGGRSMPSRGSRFLIRPNTRPKPTIGLNKQVFCFQYFMGQAWFMGCLGLNEAHAQNGRYRAYFREPPTFSSALIKPASIVAAMI